MDHTSRSKQTTDIRTVGGNIISQSPNVERCFLQSLHSLHGEHSALFHASELINSWAIPNQRANNSFY